MESAKKDIKKSNFWLQGYNAEIKKFIVRDIVRFSKLHAWFRYLPLEGKEYLIFPWKGEQPRNAISTEVVDMDGIHWWIWDSAFIDELPINGFGKEIIMKYRITLNCFFRGVERNESDGTEYEKGWSVIANKYPRVGDIMERRYPGVTNKTVYFKNEQKKQIRDALVAARRILVLLQERCPIWLTQVNSVHNPAPLVRSKRYSTLATMPVAIGAKSESSSIDSGSNTQSSIAGGKTLEDGVDVSKSERKKIMAGRASRIQLFHGNAARFRRTQSDFSLLSNRHGGDAYEYRNLSPKTERINKNKITFAARISKDSKERGKDGSKERGKDSKERDKERSRDSGQHNVITDGDSFDDIIDVDLTHDLGDIKMESEESEESEESRTLSKSPKHKFHLPSLSSWRNAKKKRSGV